jgi:ABC-type multidrug transport system ATPase subunit
MDGAAAVAARDAGDAAAAPRATPALEVRGVSLRRGGFQILRDVTFAVASRSLVGVIGPNGAGKTSLLETIAGFAPPDTGEVRIDGRTLPPAKRRGRLFYLPDGIRPCPDHRAGDVLELFRDAYDRSRSDVDDVCAGLGIEAVLRKRVREMSKGYAKRWLIALAMLTRAPLLLLDEPLDGLDVRQVGALRPLLERLRAEGRTLLLSIHELSLAERVCETFLLLAEGRLLASGDLDVLRARAAIHDGGLDDVFLALT